MTNTLTWSPFQLAIFDWAEKQRGSARVDAVAGSGKTTTLEELVRRITANQLRRTSVAFCAYNKSIAADIKARVGDLQGVRVGTFHGFGYGAWMKAYPKAKLDEKKCQNILTASEVPEEYHAFALAAVSLAKGHAIGVLTPFDSQAAWHYLVSHYELEETLTDNPLLLDDAAMGRLLTNGLAYAQQLLRASISKDGDVIDYDDMIYAPLVHNARFWENDWVLVDEAQDTNPARRALARKMLRPNGRLIAVGDPHQAIYGFTGADADALDLIEKEFACTRLPLTVSYRCPRAVVAHAQQLVSHIQSAPNAPEGKVSTQTEENFLTNTSSLTHEDAVLCRNTKPLVELAFTLIRAGVPCHVEGKDIGRGLTALARKWRIKSVEKLTERLEAYREKEVARLVAKGQEQKADSLSDRVSTVLVIAAGKQTVDEVCAAIDKLFGDVKPGQRSPNLTLCTAHKSKGREWNRVYLWGRNRYMPSKFARQQWQIQQEENLQYVAITRAKSTLIEVIVK
jgi:superfamily I DNA/RNA helicase